MDQEYCLNGYVLRVNESAYLVEVEIAYETKARTKRSADLPDWIFDSRHTIWLTDEDLSIKDRATHGDRIRERLLDLSGFCSKEV